MLHFLFNDRYTTPTLGYILMGLFIGALSCIPLAALIYVAVSDRCEGFRQWLTAHTGRLGRWLAMSLRGGLLVLIGLGFIVLSGYTIPQGHADDDWYGFGSGIPCNSNDVTVIKVTAGGNAIERWGPKGCDPVLPMTGTN